MKVELAYAEALFLFGRSMQYGRVTEDQRKSGSINWATLQIREQDVLSLFRSLRKHARHLGGVSYKLGPDDEREWDSWTLALQMNDDVRDGAFWILLDALDMQSPNKVSVQAADLIAWPIAEKIRRVKSLRRELKIEDAPRQKIEDDPEPANRLALVTEPENVAKAGADGHASVKP